MHLIQILLPLTDNVGRPFGRRLFRAVASELTARCGGLTAYTRAPAEGLWKDATANTNRDEIVVYEVMVDTLDESSWRKLRKRLERRFRQESVVVRAHEVRLL